MTEKKTTAESAKIAEIRREVLQTHRLLYGVRFRRRWGADPPSHRVKRILFVHDGPWAEGSSYALSLLASRGLAIDEWPFSLPDCPAPPDHAYHGILVTASSFPGERESRRFREMVLRGLHDATWIAAAGESVALLAAGGFFRGLHAAYDPALCAEMEKWGALPADGSPTRDGSFLTAASVGELPRLIGSLLDLILQVPGEGALS
ncbi:MAG: hypothetical protein ABIK65_00835 [Candidatus Eisenbacteria bacterium]